MMRVLALVLIVLGIVVVVRTVAAGVGLLFGTALVALGLARLYLARRA